MPNEARSDHLQGWVGECDGWDPRLSRVIGLVKASVDTDEALASLVADAREAGVELA